MDYMLKKMVRMRIPALKGPNRANRPKVFSPGNLRRYKIKNAPSGYTFFDSEKGKTNIYSPARRFLKTIGLCQPHKVLIKEHCRICDLENTIYYIFSTSAENTSYIIARPTLLNTLWYSPLGKELVARKI